MRPGWADRPRSRKGPACTHRALTRTAGSKGTDGGQDSFRARIVLGAGGVHRRRRSACTVAGGVWRRAQCLAPTHPASACAWGAAARPPRGRLVRRCAAGGGRAPAQGITGLGSGRCGRCGSQQAVLASPSCGLCARARGGQRPWAAPRGDGAEAEAATERKRKPLPSGSGSRYRKPCRLRGLGAARLGGAPAPTRLSGGVQGRQSSRCPEFPSQPGPEQKVFPAPLSRSLRREEQGGRRPPCSLPQLERPSRRPPCCGNEWGPAARRPWPRTCHEPCVWAGSFRSQPGMAARADDSDR